MDVETLEALQGSIDKWESIVAGTGHDNGPSNCPLCILFLGESEHDKRCAGCPVAEKAGCSGCNNTPYEAYDIHVHDSEWGLESDYDKKAQKLAEEELAFLISLLPEVTV